MLLTTTHSLRYSLLPTLYVEYKVEIYRVPHLEPSRLLCILRTELHIQQVVDIMLAHPSCSKQHAVIQFREVPAKDDIGIEIPGKMVTLSCLIYELKVS